MKTYTAKASDITKEWYLIDAEGLILGRLSAFVATILRGKHKNIYTPHMDCGDNVIITNASKICLTGNKLKKRPIYRHSGYPGGIKETNAERILLSSRPEKLLHMSISRMLGRGPLARKRLKNLRLYAGEKHPHFGNNPKVIDFAALNRKNRLSKHERHG